MLKGRLGLETARVPHADRHGLLSLARGRLFVSDGTLRFVAAEGGELAAGEYDIPFQLISCVLLGPGSTVSHDALRLMARHGTGLVAVGDGDVRCYASMPFGPDASALARRQVILWADPEARIRIARRMYARRLGEIFPNSEIAVLRGMEGARAKEMYKRLAASYGVAWHGRRYDRAHPEEADLPNQAINHAATAVEAGAMIAVAACGLVPQLGFIHEDSGRSLVLDLADLHRDTATIPIAFMATREALNGAGPSIDAVVRRVSNRMFREKSLIPAMIDDLKDLFADADDGDRNS